MRFKYYLRGCGLGIIFTAVILMIGFHKENKSGMSDEEVMRRAAELGMVPAEEVLSSEPATETLGTDVAEGGGQENRTDTEGSEAGASEIKPSDAAETGTDGTVKITVKKGEVCREIAEDLYEHGIIPDAEDFRLYMRDSGYDNLIRVGTFTFSPGMEYRQIAEILTSKE